MNKDKDVILSNSEVVFILKAGLIGVGFISFPNSIIKISQQDAWISCLVGAIYPIYMLVIARSLSSKFPKDNILVLSKRCFGKILGSCLNLIFISFLVFIGTANVSGYSNLFRIYTVPFMKDYQVMLAVLIVTAYMAYQGIKPLGKLCEMLFYFTIPLIVLPAAIYKEGTFLNLQPIFDSGIKNIIIGSKETLYAYTGMEMIFLLYPFLKDAKQTFKCGLISLIIVVPIYTWSVLTDIFYLGIDISPKFIWPIIALADSIKVPLINSFRYLFVALWSMVVFKCITTYYFATAFSLSEVIKRIPREAFILLLYPIFFLVSMMYGNPITRGDYLDKITPIYVIYNLVYVSFIAVLIHFKKGDNNEKT